MSDLPLLVISASVGLAIFFVGLRLLTRTLRAWAGPGLSQLLARYTSRPLVAFISGLIAAALLQSSSATNVLVVGLVSAGILQLPAAFAVILGSNVGTTVTGQIVAFSIDAAALPLLLAGATLSIILPAGSRIQRGAYIAAGCGGIFFGLSTLTGALEPIAHAPGVAEQIAAVATHPLLGVGVGAGLTALIQSSSATTAVVIGLARDGVMTSASAIAVALGSNVGTVVTTLLASVWATQTARRAAQADLIFNALGVLLILPFIGLFVEWMTWTADDPGRQVANAHTIFNVVTALVALPLIPFFHRLLNR